MIGTVFIIGIIVLWIVGAVKFITKLTKPDDWSPVWTLNAEWKEGDYFKDLDKMASYEIEFSKKRNQYRLVLHGHKPKMHVKYAKAVEVLNALQNAINETDNCVNEALEILNRK